MFLYLIIVEMKTVLLTKSNWIMQNHTVIEKTEIQVMFHDSELSPL